MNKLSKYIKENIKYIGMFVATFVVCGTETIYPELFDDVSDFITIVLMITMSYAVYKVLFDEEKKQVYRFWIICIVLMAVFVNRFYSRKQITMLLPWIEQTNVVKIAIIAESIIVVVFVIVKLLKNIDKRNEGDKLSEAVTVSDGETDMSEVQHLSVSTQADSTVSGVRTKDVKIGNMEQSVKSSGNLLYNLYIIVIIAIIVAISIFMLYIAVKSGWTILGDEPMKNVATLFICIITLMTVILAVCGGLLILIWLSKYIFKSFYTLKDESKNKNVNTKEKMPTYVLSVFVVLAILYISYLIGAPYLPKDFGLEDFTAFAAEGKYLAYPLLILLMFAVFVLLLWLINVMLVLASMVTGDKIRDVFRRAESSVKFVENCKEIVVKLFEFLFDTIKSVLNFLTIIPDYVTSMAELIGIDENKKDD